MRFTCLQATANILFYLFCLVPLIGVSGDKTQLNASIVDIKQIDANYPFAYTGKDPIHLSGITYKDNNFFIIGDKRHDPYLYSVKPSQTHWQITTRNTLPITFSASFEGVALVDNYLFVVNEDPAQIVYFNLIDSTPKTLFTVTLPPTFAKELHDAGKDNSGMEGVAFDAKTKILYIAKEREPAYILSIPLDASSNEKFAVKQLAYQPPASTGVSVSYSDLYFSNGYLYVLERRDYLVTKLDPSTGAILAQLDFSLLKDNKKSLFTRGEKYGLAEALTMSDNAIYIGLDNNGKPVNTKNAWVKKYALTGNQPVIIKLHRPEGF